MWRRRAMKCKDIEKKSLLYLYGDISDEEKRMMDDHFNSCSNCRLFVEQKKRLLEMISMGKREETQPRWDDYWRQITRRVDRADSRRRRFLPAMKWGYTVAGFALFLIIGVLIGRLVLVDPGNLGRSVVQENDHGYQNVLFQYFEDMKPLMLDLSNSLVFPKNRQEVAEQEIIDTLLIQTRLLQHRMSGRDPQVEALLSDIELILIEISNRVPEDRETAKSIRDFVEERDIPIKIDLFQQRMGKIRKI
jgi:hypothetical protein